MGSVTLLWMVLAILQSVSTGDWTWFQRSGSVLTLSGAILAGRAIVRLGQAGAEPPPAFEIAKIADSYHDEYGGLKVRVMREQKKILEERERTKDARAMVVGFVLGLGGIVISGYGDLLGVPLGAEAQGSSVRGPLPTAKDPPYRRVKEVSPEGASGTRSETPTLRP